jgi:hypothetical protein
MTAPTAWPSEKNETKTSYETARDGGRGSPAQEPSDYEPAHVLIAGMAGLLRDVRGAIVTDGCLLGGVTIGLALQAGHAARALHAGLAGVTSLCLLGGVVFCWLVAVFLLARASRPVLNAVSELRWVTGAPLDPRPGWVTLPPVGADPEEWTWNRAYLLVGAARMTRDRMQFADTWTYFTGGCFLAWTLVIILGR